MRSTGRLMERTDLAILAACALVLTATPAGAQLWGPPDTLIHWSGPVRIEKGLPVYCTMTMRFRVTRHRQARLDYIELGGIPLCAEYRFRLTTNEIEVTPHRLIIASVWLDGVSSDWCFGDLTLSFRRFGNAIRRIEFDGPPLRGPGQSKCWIDGQFLPDTEMTLNL